MFKYLFSIKQALSASAILSCCLIISSCCVLCEPDNGSDGSASSSSSSSSSGECASIPECIAPDPNVFFLQNTPCNVDHDCAKWSPCIDSRCDLAKPQSDGITNWSGSCDIKSQTEPIICGRSHSGFIFTCSNIGECCPE